LSQDDRFDKTQGMKSTTHPKSANIPTFAALIRSIITMTKNISLILNGILLLAVAHLYYLNFSKKSATEQPLAIASPASGGVKIAYVNADTLDAQYEWLKAQKKALEQRVQNAEKNMGAKKEALMKDLAAFQQKYESGTVPPAQLEKEYAALTQRQQKLAEEEARLGKQLTDEQTKAMNELMTNVEAKLKSLQSQIGYDYILSYSKGGGQVLLANDSLDITRQVLDLLNAKN
jgi:outer membrane protein